MNHTVPYIIDIRNLRVQKNESYNANVNLSVFKSYIEFEIDPMYFQFPNIPL